jgi:hypothetical protein
MIQVLIVMFLFDPFQKHRVMSLLTRNIYVMAAKVLTMTIARRIRTLERQFCTANWEKQIHLVVCRPGRGVVPNQDRCIQVLSETGFCQPAPSPS